MSKSIHDQLMDRYGSREEILKVFRNYDPPTDPNIKRNKSKFFKNKPKKDLTHNSK